MCHNNPLIYIIFHIQANNCPICRAPFRALLQLRAVQKISHAAHPALAGADPAPGLEGVPSGYMNVRYEIHYNKKGKNNMRIKF